MKLKKEKHTSGAKQAIKNIPTLTVIWPTSSSTDWAVSNPLRTDTPSPRTTTTAMGATRIAAIHPRIVRGHPRVGSAARPDHARGANTTTPYSMTFRMVMTTMRPNPKISMKTQNQQKAISMNDTPCAPAPTVVPAGAVSASAVNVSDDHRSAIFWARVSVSTSR